MIIKKQNQMISISVIIPVYNEESTLLALLKKYTYLKDKALFEIIIINDGSTDNTKKIIEENKLLYNQAIHFKKIKVRENLLSKD